MGENSSPMAKNVATLLSPVGAYLIHKPFSVGVASSGRKYWQLAQFLVALARGYAAI
jgi:hypothetical protein